MEDMILYEDEVVSYLNIPGIPKKAWNGEDSFDYGVAVTSLAFGRGRKAYAVVSFDKESDAAPRITKVFCQEPFVSVDEIFVVPSYMDGDVTDLDAESRKRAELILQEAAQLETGDDEVTGQGHHGEYYFDEIHNDDEAKAFIASYNKRNKIRGRVPSGHETLVMRLGAIYSELSKSNK